MEKLLHISDLLQYSNEALQSNKCKHSPYVVMAAILTIKQLPDHSAQRPALGCICSTEPDNCGTATGKLFAV